MKKIFYFLITILIMPILVFAQEEPKLYVDGEQVSSEGNGYFFEENILDLNNYNGGRIQIVGDGSEELNINIIVHSDSVINVSNNLYALMVTNGGKNANVTITSKNNAKLTINTEYGAISTEGTINVNSANLAINRNQTFNLEGSGLDSFESLISSTNFNANLSTIFLNQTANSGLTVRNSNCITAINKINITSSNINIKGADNSYGSNVLDAKYVTIDSSKINAEQNNDLMSLIYISADEETTDNFVTINNTTITTKGLLNIVYNTRIHMGNSETNPYSIENVTVTNSNINFESKNTTHTYYEKNIFEGIKNLKFTNSSIVASNIDSLGFYIKNISVESSDIELDKSLGLFTTGASTDTININDSTIKFNDNANFVNDEKLKNYSVIDGNIINITSSTLDFNNVLRGIDATYGITITNSTYNYVGLYHGLWGQFVIALKSSNIDIDSKNNMAMYLAATPGENDPDQKITISDDMYFENSKNHLVSCSININNYILIKDSDTCSEDDLNKGSHIVIKTKAQETKKDDAPETGIFLPVSSILLLSGIGTYIFISKKHKFN